MLEGGVRFYAPWIDVTLQSVAPAPTDLVGDVRKHQIIGPWCDTEPGGFQAAYYLRTVSSQKPERDSDLLTGTELG